jgi:hypothetical protein
MLWEAVFLLLILKIPLVYMCLVVWWAIRAEPRDEEPVAVPALTDTPSPPSPGGPVATGPRTPQGPTRRDGRGRHDRGGPRPAVARAEVRR